MASKESQLARQVRLNQWAQEIQDCLNRPEDMTVGEWCELHHIKKANYYWRLKQVRQACLVQMDVPMGDFVELPVPVQPVISVTPDTVIAGSGVSTSAVLRTAEGISIEIMESATADFIKNLIGAFTHA